jgi:nitrogen fixation/metabolism regulation signal transduction histidine kinase
LEKEVQAIATPRTDRMFAAIKDLSEGMEGLARKLLLTTREGVLPETQIRPVLLAPLLRSLAFTEATYLQQQGIDEEEVVSLEVDPTLEVPADVVALTMGLTTALRNASGSLLSLETGDDPQIRIRAYRDGDQIKVRIEDNGNGFPLDYLKRAQATARAKDGNVLLGLSTTSGGSGIGLPVMIKVARLHRGQIEFSNKQAPESGAVVEFAFPAVAPHAETLQMRSAA